MTIRLPLLVVLLYVVFLCAVPLRAEWDFKSDFELGHQLSVDTAFARAHRNRPYALATAELRE